MSIYKYRVTLGREDIREEGTVVAKDEYEAKEKLRALDFRDVKLKKLTGFSAFVKQFMADVK